ncbi:uncharacterized protein LOC134948780 [Pseudophryne corroboree]|uniref:uncharacterized protein LOC134948780 n=1 Tax=Pseudophryne corroboree TaxID=495146 RepID=UPI0030812C30
MDVNSLYTSIPHSEGLEAVQEFVSRIQEPFGFHIPLFLQLLRLVLTRNYFLYDGRYYLQAQGCAMGSAVAPAYANIYMFKLEQEFFLNNADYKKHICWYTRYIDDCFMLWNSSEEAFLEMMTNINHLPSSIKFTFKISTTRVNFLDVIVTNQQSHLETSVYYKPTDRNTLLEASSHHPKALKQGLPHSQMLRIARITSNADDLPAALDITMNKFIQRGYDPIELAKTKAKVLQIPRQGLLNQQIPADTKDKFIWSTTFSTTSPMITRATKALWPIVKTDPSLPCFTNKTPMTSFRRGKNLRDHLVKADITNLIPSSGIFGFSKKPGCYKCASCTTCKYLISGSTFQHPHKNKKYEIQQILTCSSRFVIYYITCPCNKYYIGMTSRMFKERMALHRSAITKSLQGEQNDQPVARHFKTCQHSLGQLRYQIIDQLPPMIRGGDKSTALQKLESRWIFKLDTIHPNGLNEKINWNIL